LHLVGSSILLYLIDDARSNKNQIKCVFWLCATFVLKHFSFWEEFSEILS